MVVFVGLEYPARSASTQKHKAEEAWSHSDGVLGQGGHGGGSGGALSATGTEQLIDFSVAEIRVGC